MITLRQLSRTAFVLPLALALGACGSGADKDAAPPQGDAIAAIAAPAGQAWADMITVSPEGGYVMGNPDAPLKLVEYASLTCSHCASFIESGAEPLKEKYVKSGVVSWELRNQIHDPFDLTMAMLVRCGEPAAVHPLSEQVWQNLDGIFDKIQTNQASVETAMEVSDQGRRYKAIADATGLTDFFAARGVGTEQSATCLARAEDAEKLVNNSEQQTKELEVDGTPTFFLNNKKLDARSWAELEPLLQNAGAR